MLTTKLVKRQDFAFYWNDEKLEEIKTYLATVVWPNGTEETLVLNIELEYVGYDDFPWQSAFLAVIHNGFETYVEISDIPEHLALVKNLTEIKSWTKR